LWSAPAISVVAGLFMIVLAVWLVSTVVSFPLYFIRQLLPIKRPFLRRALAFALTSVNNAITDIAST
jgi:hypothetical protein